MPLRDHFRPPLDDESSWEGFHGGWPMMIVADLVKQLPPRYVAAPRVQLGASVEIDVATYEQDVSDAVSPRDWNVERSCCPKTDVEFLQDDDTPSIVDPSCLVEPL